MYCEITNIKSRLTLIEEEISRKDCEIATSKESIIKLCQENENLRLESSDNLLNLNNRVEAIEIQVKENDKEFETIDDNSIAVALRVASIERFFQNSLLRSPLFQVELCQPSCCLNECGTQCNYPPDNDCCYHHYMRPEL